MEKPSSRRASRLSLRARWQAFFEQGPAAWCFLAGMLVYLATRLVALGKFPIYFFTDEAIQTMAASDLITRGFRDTAGRLLPLYFENGGQYNLSLSVYLQLLPALLPRAVWITRAVPALISVLTPLSLSFTLKQHFKLKAWWLTPLVLSALPAWFLHSRTAFETSLGVSMFSCFVYFYLSYRDGKRKQLYPSLLFGALAFYAYSPLQIVVVLSGLFLLISDFHYHLEDRRQVLEGLAWLVVLAAPYLLFRYTHPGSLTQHLRILQSYWLGDAAWWHKLLRFGENYLRAFNPLYWFLPNQGDLVRHQIKGLGHLPAFYLPLVLLGLTDASKRIQEPPRRLLLLVLLAAPCGAALVSLSVTRLLVMLIPLTLLTMLGLEALFAWTGNVLRRPKLLQTTICILLALFSLGMFAAALVRGPLWYQDYGLYGMQWGAERLFSEIQVFQAREPEKHIILSPNWANGTDMLARYFLGDPLPIQLGTIEAYTLYPLPLNTDMVFIMTPEEYAWVQTGDKFQDLNLLHSVAYPNGQPGFFFVSLGYVDDIDAIFAAELAKRREPLEATLSLLSQDVQVSYPLLDINSIYQAFDADPNTLLRGFEANPLRITLSFAEPVQLSSVTALVGGNPSRLEAVFTVADSGQDISVRAELGASAEVRPLQAALASPQWVSALSIALSNLNEGEPAHVHLWELILE